MTGHIALLKSAGEALYGRSWQTELAEALGVSAREVRFWATGERRIPDRAMPSIKALLARREVEIAALWERFETAFPEDE